jgi:two-component system, cell cycle response regulator
MAEADITILLVDDSRTMRAILRRSLVGAGYRVIEAGDGAEGVLQCRDQQPDLVLMDVDMPVMNGHEALIAIRSDDATSDTAVVFLTARSGTDDVIEGLGLGAQDYLKKPCEPGELLARVKGTLMVKAKQDELRRRAQEATASSSIDALTGLGNRRFLEDNIRLLTSDYHTLAAIMIDIDFFKRINDTEGHPTGDLVLQEIAARLARELREPTVLGRYGGEEFLVVVPELDEAAVAVIGERLRRSVSATTVEIGDGRSIDVTVSVGVAVGPAKDLSDSIARADAALYKAKRNGRNRLEVAV